MANKRESGKQQFEIACASRGFHVYRELWKPKIHDIDMIEVTVF